VIVPEYHRLGFVRYCRLEFVWRLGSFGIRIGDRSRVLPPRVRSLLPPWVRLALPRLGSFGAPALRFVWHYRAWVRSALPTLGSFGCHRVTNPRKIRPSWVRFSRSGRLAYTHVEYSNVKDLAGRMRVTHCSDHDAGPRLASGASLTSMITHGQWRDARKTFVFNITAASRPQPRQHTPIG
jgi:hypothetical protein